MSDQWEHKKLRDRIAELERENERLREMLDKEALKKIDDVFCGRCDRPVAEHVNGKWCPQ